MKICAAAICLVILLFSSIVLSQNSGGRILFTRIGQPTSSIHTVNADGTDERNLTFGETGSFPTWSQNGLYIAYDRFQSGIVVMNADGTNKKLISTGGAVKGWSSDDTKLLYTVGNQIWTMNVDGSNKVFLTEAGTPDSQPTWSPTGELIAFTSCSGSPQNCDIHTIRPDGTQEQNITPLNPLDDIAARWSPDGTRLVFASMYAENQYNSVSVLTDGSGAINLTNASDTESFMPAAFSPDGSSVTHIFRTLDQPAGDIFVSPSNGSSLHQVTAYVGPDLAGPWSPDGTRIAFISSRPPIFNRSVFTVKSDGSDIIRLTQNIFSAGETLYGWKAVAYSQPGSGVMSTPAPNVTVVFSNATSGGTTSLTRIPPAIAPPANFAPSSGFIFYDISSTVAFSGAVSVILVVNDIATAEDCEGLALMHFSNGAWSQAGNAEPIFNASSKSCTLDQTVESLSPFAVALRDRDLDSHTDYADNCPFNFNPTQSDFDGDGVGDVCDSPTGPPTIANQCKDLGWQNWQPRFRNQGACIQYVNTGK